MTSPRLSVVMPVFNAGPYLDAAIASIRDQTFGDFEFVIVDDGSTDGTTARLAHHAGQDNRLRIESQDHQGIVHAINHGLAVSSGALIARMDADDIAAPERFGRQLQAFERDPDLVAIGSAYNEINDAGQVVATRHPPTEDQAIRTTLRRTNCMAHPTVMMRRDAVLGVGGYRRAFVHGEDYDLWVRLGEIGKLANLSDILLQYRVYPRARGADFVEQRTLTELAVHGSAALRRAGRADPANDAERITREVVRALGVERAVVDFEVMRRALQAARRARILGERKMLGDLVGLASHQQLTGVYGHLYYWATRLRVHV